MDSTVGRCGRVNGADCVCSCRIRRNFMCGIFVTFRAGFRVLRAGWLKIESVGLSAGSFEAAISPDCGEIVAKPS